MSLNHSPKIVTDNLAFYIDFANTKKSWFGAPATNIIPSPAINGRFTTANGWGTYNTNQYGSGTYFSIGTISSVTGNIVTTAAAHSLRTFDVMQPQTTGGGVTAGTNYFIQKLSSTTFQLHAYNSDQTGSLGYISTTGYHKVHDSIALNQQVAINATSFPNMWWGSPHLPNSHLVKEIVAGAGPDGQNVMRLHIPGATGAVDGMAYGVNTPVTAGQTINVSYWVRCSRADKQLNYQTYFGPSMGVYGNTHAVSTQWTKIKHQWTASATYQFIQYFFPGGTTDTRYWIDICDLQVEVNTVSGASPFVAGTRSSTQSIIDLVSTDAIQLNGQNFIFGDKSITINNVNDQFIAHNNPVKMRMGLQNFQICAWIKQLDNSYNIITEARGGSLIGYFFALNYNAAGKMSLFLNNSAGQQIYITTNATLPTGVVQYVCCSVDRVAATIKFYLNGVLFDTITGIHTATISPTTGDVYRIGYDHGGSTTNMEIFAYQHYTKALTANEILQNFNAQRQRYGL